jgi:hypothetical protein
MKKQRDYVAKLTIHGIPEMNKYQIKRLINWIKKTKEKLEIETKDPKVYSKMCTWRLMK